ncbi:hypothetical protein GCM10009818_01980 [Nakamurella flavida]
MVVSLLITVLAGCSTGALAEGNRTSVPAGSAAAASPVSESRRTEPASEAPTASTAGSPDTTPAPARQISVFPLPAGLTPEASGIARSAADPGVFFLVDDANGPATIDAVRLAPDGARRAGRWLVDQVTVGNPEALATGSCGPRGPADTRCLYLGDIGEADRDDIAVLRVAEPPVTDDPAASGTVDDPAVLVAQELVRFTYPDTPQDAESMAVDTDGAMLILSKPRKPALGEQGDPVRLYRGDPGGGVLTLVTEFRLPAPLRPLQSRLVGVRPTDMAVDGDRVLVLTYDQVLEYRRPDPAAPLTDFPTWPVQELTSASLPQAEGIAGAGDGCGFVVASEAGPGGSVGSLATVTC